MFQRALLSTTKQLLSAQRKALLAYRQQNKVARTSGNTPLENVTSSSSSCDVKNNIISTTTKRNFTTLRNTNNNNNNKQHSVLSNSHKQLSNQRSKPLQVIHQQQKQKLSNTSIIAEESSASNIIQTTTKTKQTLFDITQEQRKALSDYAERRRCQTSNNNNHNIRPMKPEDAPEFEHLSHFQRKFVIPTIRQCFLFFRETFKVSRLIFAIGGGMYLLSSTQHLLKQLDWAHMEVAKQHQSFIQRRRHRQEEEEQQNDNNQNTTKSISTTATTKYNYNKINWDLTYITIRQWIATSLFNHIIPSPVDVFYSFKRYVLLPIKKWRQNIPYSLEPYNPPIQPPPSLNHINDNNPLASPLKYQFKPEICTLTGSFKHDVETTQEYCINNIHKMEAIIERLEYLESNLNSLYVQGFENLVELNQEVEELMKLSQLLSEQQEQQINNNESTFTSSPSFNTHSKYDRDVYYGRNNTNINTNSNNNAMTTTTNPFGMVSPNEIKYGQIFSTTGKNATSHYIPLDTDRHNIVNKYNDVITKLIKQTQDGINFDNHKKLPKCYNSLLEQHLQTFFYQVYNQHLSNPTVYIDLINNKEDQQNQHNSQHLPSYKKETLALHFAINVDNHYGMDEITKHLQSVAVSFYNNSPHIQKVDHDDNINNNNADDNDIQHRLLHSTIVTPYSNNLLQEQEQQDKQENHNNNNNNNQYIPSWNNIYKHIQLPQNVKNIVSPLVNNLLTSEKIQQQVQQKYEQQQKNSNHIKNKQPNIPTPILFSIDQQYNIQKQLQTTIRFLKRAVLHQYDIHYNNYVHQKYTSNNNISNTSQELCKDYATYLMKHLTYNISLLEHCDLILNNYIKFFTPLYLLSNTKYFNEISKVQLLLPNNNINNNNQEEEKSDDASNNNNISLIPPPSNKINNNHNIERLLIECIIGNSKTQKNKIEYLSTCYIPTIYIPELGHITDNNNTTAIDNVHPMNLNYNYLNVPFYNKYLDVLHYDIRQIVDEEEGELDDDHDNNNIIEHSTNNNTNDDFVTSLFDTVFDNIIPKINNNNKKNNNNNNKQQQEHCDDTYLTCIIEKAKQYSTKQSQLYSLKLKKLQQQRKANAIAATTINTQQQLQEQQQQLVDDLSLLIIPQINMNFGV